MAFSIIQPSTRNLATRLSTGLALALSMACACSEDSDNPMAGREVGINTIREPFHKSDKPCGPYPNYYLEYLDDTKCRKRLPRDRDRNFQCPIISSAASIEGVVGYAPARSSSDQVEVDEFALSNFFPEDASVTLILIRRIDGVPYYRYLSNGRHNEILETWSSSKFLGVMNASETIRYESNGELGLNTYIGEHPVGDLVSVVHNYDERTYTSNGLMYWFHDVGGRTFANQMIHSRWLHRPNEEVYGGNYGAKAPQLGFTFTQGDQEVKVTQDQGWIRSNNLSTFTLAEALKRLVMYRENPETQLEYSLWEDVQVLLYGAENSAWYDDKTPQGMEGDTSVYMQSAVDIKAVDENTEGRWRVFSKLGLGFSRGGEIVHTDYACFPEFDEAGQPLLDRGIEMVISTHLPVHERYAGGDAELARIYQSLVQAVLRGELR